MVGALLAEARPAALEGNRLTVAFGADAAFSKKKAEANRDLLLKALRGLTGSSFSVAFELGGAAVDEGPPLLSEAELLQRLRDEFGAEEIFEEDD